MKAIEQIAAQKRCVAAQVALAWVLGQGDHVVAIPGTTKLTNLESNLGALECQLDEEDVAVLNQLAGQVLGERYDPDGMAAIDQ